MGGQSAQNAIVQLVEAELTKVQLDFSSRAKLTQVIYTHSAARVCNVSTADRASRPTPLHEMQEMLEAGHQLSEPYLQKLITNSLVRPRLARLLQLKVRFSNVLRLRHNPIPA